MIPRKLRLSPADFPRQAPFIQKKAAFSVKARRNNRDHHRFALVIGLKSEKSSVRRHLLRRRFLSRAVRLPGRGADLLFILSPGAAKMSRREMDEAFKELGGILTK